MKSLRARPRSTFPVLVALTFAAVGCAPPPDNDPGEALPDVESYAVMNKRPTVQGPDPGGDTPVGGGGGGTSSGGGPTGGNNCGAAEDQCLGAVGLACHGILISTAPIDGRVAGCNGDWCAINAGSWAHDECCVTTPNGHWCGAENAHSSSACVASWHRAVHRVSHGLNWTRRLDRCRHDTDGLVNFDEYCANDGAIVATVDASFCCSRQTRAYNAQTDGATAQLQGVVFDGSFTPAVCAAGPPVGKRCTSNAQCPPGKQCLPASPGSPITICRVNINI